MDSLGRMNGIQTNLHGEFAAVFAQAVQLASSAHRPRLRIRQKLFAIVWVLGAIPLREQRIQRLFEQFLPGVTEHFLHL